MLNTVELSMIALVRSALSGKAEKLPDGFVLSELLPLIKRQQIWTMALVGATVCGVNDDLNSLEKLLEASGQALSVAENQQSETDALLRAFEEAGVDYLPLKGIALKELYPDTNLRSMSDVDILIRVEQYPHIVPIMKANGFLEGAESDHELNWTKGNVHIELHKCLIPSYNKKLYAYFEEGWSKSKPIAPDARRYAMSDEDFFIYLFTHYSKHFRDGGIGIKHLADLWIYRNAKANMDNAYIEKELKKIDLDVFYRNVLQAVSFWFEEGPATEMAEYITRVTIGSGAFGNAAAQRNAMVVRNSPAGGKSAKLRWTLRMVFLPYKNMCQKYPCLRYMPFLLPVMWVVRWIAVLFKPKKLKKQMKEANSLSPRAIDEYRDSLAYVGLGFDKKE